MTDDDLLARARAWPYHRFSRTATATLIDDLAAALRARDTELAAALAQPETEYEATAKEAMRLAAEATSLRAELATARTIITDLADCGPEQSVMTAGLRDRARAWLASVAATPPTPEPTDAS